MAYLDSRSFWSKESLCWNISNFQICWCDLENTKKPNPNSYPFTFILMGKRSCERFACVPRLPFLSSKLITYIEADIKFAVHHLLPLSIKGDKQMHILIRRRMKKYSSHYFVFAPGIIQNRGQHTIIMLHIQ